MARVSLQRSQQVVPCEESTSDSGGGQYLISPRRPRAASLIPSPSSTRASSKQTTSTTAGWNNRKSSKESTGSDVSASRRGSKASRISAEANELDKASKATESLPSAATSDFRSGRTYTVRRSLTTNLTRRSSAPASSNEPLPHITGSPSSTTGRFLPEVPCAAPSRFTADDLPQSPAVGRSVSLELPPATVRGRSPARVISALPPSASNALSSTELDTMFEKLLDQPQPGPTPLEEDSQDPGQLCPKIADPVFMKQLEAADEIMASATAEELAGQEPLEPAPAGPSAATSPSSATRNGMRKWRGTVDRIRAKVRALQQVQLHKLGGDDARAEKMDGEMRAHLTEQIAEQAARDGLVSGLSRHVVQD